MAYPTIERRLYPEGGDYAPTGTGQTILGRCGVSPPGERVIGAACRVKRANNGTGAVTFGRAGLVDAWMTSADVGSTVVGLKETCTGVGLNGNGSLFANPMNITADYTIGTATIHPLIRFMLFVTQKQDWDAAVRDLGA